MEGYPYGCRNGCQSVTSGKEESERSIFGRLLQAGLSIIGGSKVEICDRVGWLMAHACGHYHRCRQCGLAKDESEVASLLSMSNNCSNVRNDEAL